MSKSTPSTRVHDLQVEKRFAQSLKPFRLAVEDPTGDYETVIVARNIRHAIHVAERLTSFEFAVYDDVVAVTGTNIAARPTRVHFKSFVDPTEFDIVTVDPTVLRFGKTVGQALLGFPAGILLAVPVDPKAPKGEKFSTITLIDRGDPIHAEV